MTPLLHRASTDEVLEMAALYMAGALDAPGAAEFERHLEEGCPACNAEVRAFRGTSACLAMGAPARSPRPQLRDKLMHAVEDLSPARMLVRAAEGKWKTWAPGILVKRLFVDRLTGAVTQLVKVDPGAIYPAHRHGGLEHIYVIDGDVSFEDHELGEGDYEVSMESSHHSRVTTREGCLLLIINNMRDELE